LDGWRAVSIILVLGAHSSVVTGVSPEWFSVLNWLFDGSLGVRFFFVISGFLITWLMFVEQERTGRVNLREFYVRRALRILPVYYAYLAVLLALQLLTQFRLSALSWLGNITFTTNFLSASWANGHLWSLAQEEQFYFVWPTLFRLTRAFRRVSTAAFILAAPMVLCPMVRIMNYLHVLPSLLSRGRGFISCDSIAIGCASAIIFARRRAAIREIVSAHGSLVATLGATLILVPYVFTGRYLLGAITVPLGQTSQAVGFSILILQSVSDPGFVLYRPLSWRWMSEVGVLSYSFYIWQQLFCTNPSEFGFARHWWMTFPGWLVPVVVVGLLSYYCLERPLFRLRARFRSW